MLGPALWQVTPDFAIKDGLGVAFAPGFDVPDAFVDDFKRMTYTSYSESGPEENDYSGAIPLDRRIARAGLPLLAIFGAEDQIYDSRKAIAAYSPGPRRENGADPGVGPLAERREAGADGAARPRIRLVSGTKCRNACRMRRPSEYRPNLRTHVRFKDNTERTADRRRRPADRFRDTRRVRAGARWENFAELRGPRPGTEPEPHHAVARG